MALPPSKHICDSEYKYAGGIHNKMETKIRKRQTKQEVWKKIQERF
jgi:hypothetical protein